MVTLLRHPQRQAMLCSRIEILGVFGSGKTTLAQHLSNGRESLMLERHEHNVYWNTPGANAATGFLAYDLSFLLQHHYLAASCPSASYNGVALCDWSFASDDLWASMRLNDDDLDAYRTVHGALLKSVGPPLGYIHLRPPERTIAERLRLRNRAGENISTAEISDAADRLDELVQQLPSAKVMRVGDDADLVNIRNLFEHWLRGRTGER
jgi:deoxyadenosine/deoxycytidine kinase